MIFHIVVGRASAGTLSALHTLAHVYSADRKYFIADFIEFRLQHGIAP